MFNDQNPIHEFRGPWGVPIQIGGSIIFILLFYISFSGTPRDIAYDVIFVVILMGSILLHELGHAWGCLIQSVPVKRIMLHGAGGFCERTRSATRYEQELIVAMGPLVTLALWALATLAGDVMHAAELSNANVIWGLDTIAWVNIYLFVFNMIPLQPLDGGKLFELLLSRFLHPAIAEKNDGHSGHGDDRFVGANDAFRFCSIRDDADVCSGFRGKLVYGHPPFACTQSQSSVNNDSRVHHPFLHNSRCDVCLNFYQTKCH